MTLRVFLFFMMFAVAAPQVSYGQGTCGSLFNGKINLYDQHKVLILESALSQTKIKLAADPQYIDKILKTWNLTDSTPAKVERIAQALVMKKDSRKSFSAWLKGLILKGDHVKEAVRIRMETDILTIEILDALDVRGYRYENSRYDRYADFRNKHYNKIQLAKFAVINAAIIINIQLLTGSNFFIPLYFPNIDLVRNLKFRAKDKFLAQTQGFPTAYPYILKNYKAQLKTQYALENAPLTLFSAAMTYVAYNYFTLKAEQMIEESRYTITENQKIPVQEKYFLEWKKEFEKSEGRTLDMKNAQDQHQWDLFVQSLYRAWADMYNAKNGHFPDLTKEQDLQEWNQFLSSVQ